MRRCLLPLLCLIFWPFVSIDAQDVKPPEPSGPRPERVEIAPASLQAVVGQMVKFEAAAFDASNNKLDAKPSAWFATPFDVAAADEHGLVTFYRPGVVRVGAIVNGKAGFARVAVTPQSVARIVIEPLDAPLVVGGSVTLRAMAYTPNGDPRADVAIAWTTLSGAPSAATVDNAGVLTGVAPGKVVVRATADRAEATTMVQVVSNRVTGVQVEPRAIEVRTGDVVRFVARPKGERGTANPPSFRWAVSGDGATVEPDGAFVAERPGSYIVTAASGDRAGSASVRVTPRNAQRELEVVGRTPLEEFQTSEQWIVGKYAYVASLIAGKLWVYDISNPAAPVKVDSLAFDARILNDVSITPDGKIGVVTREGASSRKNGIVFLDTSDLAHPKVVSEYTETVTGGVHSAYIDGHHVYLTDDATGSMRVISFKDVKAPKEVARWEVENPLSKTINTPEGPMMGGRMLHDVQVKDGLAYLAYWRDGLVVLDVGKGIRGGSPEKPMFVSQLRFNYHELYGPGWVAGAHAVFRYKNYVFVGDEVFPAQFDLVSRNRIPVKGIVHVVDVSDIARPRKVAEYEVPEAGAHNVWVDDDVMYMGYYDGGARVVDVSGELRGNLYRQGREIARFWTGDPKGYRPNLPFTWGAQPHNGLVFFNDINTGIWITRLAGAKAKPTTEP